MPQIDKRHIFIVVGFLLAIAMVYWSTSYQEDNVSQEQVLKWIQEGYPSQFCTNIYPNLEDCLSITVTQCEEVAKQQVQPCVNELVQSMPQSMTTDVSKKYYAQASVCFEGNMRTAIVQNYLLNTQECQQRMQ